MEHDFEIVADLLIFSVDACADDVAVDVYGSAPARCATVRFTFRDDDLRRDNVATLRGWCETATPVTFVDRGSEVSLVDGSRLLKRMLTEPSG